MPERASEFRDQFSENDAPSHDGLDSLTAGTERPLADAFRRLRPSGYGVLLLSLCIFVGVVEGYDVKAMAFAAPLVAREWNLAPQAVGLLLSASLVGQVFGGFLLAPLGDRIGRRKAMLFGLAITGIATFASAFVPDFGSMFVSRLIAGLGLGFALANTITLAMELVPTNWRTLAVVLVCSGYPLGAAIGAMAVGLLLPVYGVAAAFYVGGAGTLAAFLAVYLMLPESPVMMVRRSEDQTALRNLFRKLGVPINPSVRLVGQDSEDKRSNVAALFTVERRATTLLLWLLMFANLSLVFFFGMWMPSLFVQSGFEPRDAISATSLFNFSGIAGGLVLAALLPRLGPIKTLGSCYLLMIGSIAGLAAISHTSPLFYLTLGCCGFLIIGSQFCLNAVVNLFYPGPIRVTGLGFAFGVGRIGGVIAPLVGGLILANVSSPSVAFYVGIVPAAISFIALVALRRLKLSGAESE